MNDRPRRIIDFHVHVFPDKVAPKAIQAFVNTYHLQPLSDGTVADTSAYMASIGVDAYVPLPVATKPSQVVDINNWASSVRSDVVMPFGSMHPEFPDVRGEIDRLVSAGFNGIKLQPDWQEFYPDDEKAFPIYEAAEGRLAVLFHGGREIDEMGIVYSTPDRLRRVHDRFPGLTLIIAHMGGYRCWKQAEEYLYGTGVYFDMSYCPAQEMPDDELLRLLRKHGTKKFVMASDFPFADPKLDIERLCRLDLTQDEREDMAWRNAERILGMRD